MNRRRTLMHSLAAAAVGLSTFVAGSATAAITYDNSFGAPGTGSAQFANPTGVAVNEDTGDVYVVDRDNNRIQRFDQDGTFIAMWGRNVNATTNGDLCTAASGNVCQAGSAGGGSGWFNDARGIAIDNSGGPADGSVYVQEAGNVRVQRFTADGDFVLMWGRGVNQTTGGLTCTAVSGDMCRAGEISGDAETTPPVPSLDGAFAGWGGYYAARRDPNIAVDGDGNVYVGEGNAVPYPRVQKFDSSGTFISKIAPPPTGAQGNIFAINFVTGVAAGATGDVFVNDVGGFSGSGIKRFEPDDFTATGESALIDSILGGGSGVERPTVDPHNGFVFGLGPSSGCGGSGSPRAVYEFHPEGQQVDCTVPTSPTIPNTGGGGTGGLAVSSGHRLYVADTVADRVHIFVTPVATPPHVGGQEAGEITSTKAVVSAEVAANLGETTYHVEYGTTPCSEIPSTCASTDESGNIGAAFAPEPVSGTLTGLEPETTYFYRVVATNEAGSEAGPDLSFTTYRESMLDPACANNLARQQTGASLLPDCRAYELVSAENQGGYNVTTDLVPGQAPYGGFPFASDRALYSVHNGGIPGSGKPTNRGPDPYLATRDAENQRWVTQYVGVPVDAPSDEPFSSTVLGADAALDSFAFGGPEMCAPCFGDGSSGVPLRRPGEGITQGMIGSIPVPMPEAAGEVRKPFSDDGGHFIFGSEQQFEPAGNPGDGNVTIYDRDLDAGTTQVASTLPSGATIAAGAGVAALDVSADGSRILIGELVATDADGNSYWDLYMHVGSDPQSLEIVSGGTGVMYNGMTRDGSQVFFSTRDSLAGDTDTSLDLYRAAVTESVSLDRVSTGSGGTGNSDACDPAGNSFNPDAWNTAPGGPADCSIVAVGGGGGVATSSGAVYFLSPESLDGDGVEGAPNLYLARPGADPIFVATLESSASKALEPGQHPFVRTFGSFDNPEGVAIDEATGSTYVLDNLSTTVESPGAFVQKFDSAGNVDTNFGTGGKIDGSGSPTGQFLQIGNKEELGAEYGSPTSIAVDNNPASPSYRSIYVPDMAHSVVDRFGPSGEYLSQLTGPEYPTGVAVNPANGNVYITGFFGEAQVFDATGAPLFSFSIPFVINADIAVDSSGDIYITTGSETRHYDPAGVFVGSFGSGAARGVDVDPADDHIYIGDGSAVREFDTAGTQVGLTFGSGSLSESVSLAAHSGRVVVSNGGNVAEFGLPETPSDPGYDHPLVIDSVRSADTRNTADFQTSSSGDYAVFPTTLPLTGYDSGARYEVYRHGAGSGDIECVSCTPTGLPPAGDSSLASNGLSLTDDGRVFFTTGEPLVRRDTNQKKDAYQWADGDAELISTGQSPFDSGLLSVSADGTDAFFFTRETLASNDRNGNLMKLYTARAGGGFFVIPPPPECVASDECHGPSSQRPVPSPNATGTGVGGNAAPPKRCKRGSVKRRGKCVRKRKRHSRKKARRGRKRGQKQKGRAGKRKARKDVGRRG